MVPSAPCDPVTPTLVGRLFPNPRHPTLAHSRTDSALAQPRIGFGFLARCLEETQKCAYWQNLA